MYARTHAADGHWPWAVPGRQVQLRAYPSPGLDQATYVSASTEYARKYPSRHDRGRGTWPTEATRPMPLAQRARICMDCDNS